MPNDLHPAKKIYPAHGDAIRIVPLHLPDTLGQPTAEAAAALPAAAPQLTYRNGPLLTAVEVFTIFWGPAWQQAPQSAMLTQINQFFDFILTSPLIQQLAEYSVPGKTIGNGKHTGTLTITTPKLKHSVSDTAIQHMLQQEIASNPAVPIRRRIRSTSSICRPAFGLCRAGRPRVRHSAATTTTYRVRYSMLRCLTRVAPGAPAASRPSMR